MLGNLINLNVVSLIIRTEYIISTQCGNGIWNPAKSKPKRPSVDCRLEEDINVDFMMTILMRCLTAGACMLPLYAHTVHLRF